MAYSIHLHIQDHPYETNGNLFHQFHRLAKVHFVLRQGLFSYSFRMFTNKHRSNGKHGKDEKRAEEQIKKSL